jgi:hypothetical protein
MIYEVFKKLFFKFFIAKLSIYYYQDSTEYMFLKNNTFNFEIKNDYLF